MLTLFFSRASANLELNVVHFKTYGKNFIKSQRMSPDSFIQMAMQYAFYKYVTQPLQLFLFFACIFIEFQIYKHRKILSVCRLHGEPGAHYETAQVR